MCILLQNLPKEKKGSIEYWGRVETDFAIPCHSMFSDISQQRQFNMSGGQILVSAISIAVLKPH